jgi:hypothetical protein
MWIDRVEKLGGNRLRVVAKTPTAFDESRLSYLTGILPRHIHGKLQDRWRVWKKTAASRWNRTRHTPMAAPPGPSPT